MMRVAIVLITCALISPMSAFADQGPQGSKVVEQGEDCPSGMVVSGMTGGEDVTTKICVSPNTNEMPNDDVDVGDPDTNE
jgi:hypothetical protein